MATEQTHKHAYACLVIIVYWNLKWAFGEAACSYGYKLVSTNLQANKQIMSFEFMIVRNM